MQRDTAAASAALRRGLHLRRPVVRPVGAVGAAAAGVLVVVESQSGVEVEVEVEVEEAAEVVVLDALVVKAPALRVCTLRGVLALPASTR